MPSKTKKAPRHAKNATRLRRSYLIAALLLAVGGGLVGVVRCQPGAVRAPDHEATAELVPPGDWSFGTVPPGTSGFPADLVTRLERRWQDRPKGYEPRTRHLREDGSPKYTNRLFLESSPYLRQHAHNPVNWFPWGDEAFELAKKLGRPVLLSVGYSTCHWCHVMEEESFEDEEIADYLNRHYIAIKVDREERPDVDSIYMRAVRMLTGGGGWPMTVWLTPDRKPFYGGTYFPPRDGVRGARKGFLSLLQDLKGDFAESPDQVADRAVQLTRRIQASLERTPSGDLPDPSTLHGAIKLYAGNFDDTYGGRARARNKFPSSLPNRLLLRYHRRTGDERALRMATLTLSKMAAGGMYDHVGGGFHRYSTDRRWLVPHFEKMLYDNALLTLAYLDGFQATGNADFARVARETLDYVARDMTSAGGAFYSATDADSLNPEGHREEGWFFTWTPAEIEQVLPEALAKSVIRYYAVTDRGNFEGRNILHTPKPLPSVAAELGMASGELRKLIDRARQELYQAREKRPPPIRDEKILTAWNGMMISAFAHGALVLDELRYLKQAERAASFVLKRMKRDGRLLRSFKDGRTKHNAYLDDYAFLIAGLIDLYEVSHEPAWLEHAMQLTEVVEEHYADDDEGGYFMTSGDHESLLAREKPAYDGAEPSGNSIHALNLLRLYELTTKERFRERGERTLKAFGAALKRSPGALSEMLLAVDFHLDHAKQVILVTPESVTQAEPFVEKLRREFLPNRVLAVVSAGEMQAKHQRIIPLLEQKLPRRGEATAYVCERRVCKFPTTDPEVFARQIREVRALAAAE